MTSTAPLSSTPKTTPAKSPVAANNSSSRNARITATPSSPQFSTLLSKTESDSGKRMFRTSDGKMVELPDDMTTEEAARLESEAKAAQKKLGKGPSPKPVPNVKQPAKKEGKTAKPNPKGKKAGKGKGKSMPKTGAAVSTLLKIGTGKVAQYLAAKGTPALVKGVSRLKMLSRNEQTHDNAGEKLNQTEKAVVIPASEGQSKSNSGQVNLVSAKPAPVADENKAKQKLQESLKENIPKSIEDVDNFKRDMKAQHMGNDVMKVVQGDKNAVITTFADMGKTPPPTPPEQAPEALPPEEIAPSTPNMDLGQGTIAPLQKEHTDVSNFTKEADGKLKEEGVTQEQLDMVDSGDLAAANKEKKGMETTAKTEPLAVQKLALQETQKIDRDLKQEEKKERTALKAKRKAGLGATANKQKGAKSALEKKREEVAIKINGIFTKAQNSVKKKLADLETQSMKRFDDGNAKATKEFEDNVNREIDAFKDDRYSGFFGWARKAKDWLLGMDDLPEVKAIFERNRTVFVTTINKLVEDISADNKRVIQECKDELANAKLEIKDYVDKLGPALKDVGKKAADEMNSKLAEMDQFITQKEEELQNKLKDKQQAAIKAIDEKIEKMKEAMSGALAKLGKLLLLAAKKFFTWALEKVGFSLSDIEGIINKGVAVLKAIFTKPIQFVKNLVKAAMTGFENFGKNFLKHLKNALFEWLTGSLEGLVLPSTWDFKGIVSIALQMIGISYQNIRRHMVTVMGEPVVAGLEKTFTLVKTLITEGPMAAWEQLKEMAGEMKQAFIDAVKDFIKTKIIEQAIQWVVSLFIPGAGIVKAIIGIYDTIVFFIQKAKQIMQMIANFLGAIGEIAAGNIGAAADALENGLARGLSLVISFLAQLLHLSGITKKIKDAIQKIRAKVDAVLAKVAKWIADKAKKLIGKVFGKKDQKPDERTDAQKKEDLNKAVSEAKSLDRNQKKSSVFTKSLERIKKKYRLMDLTAKQGEKGFDVHAQINPEITFQLEADDDDRLAKMLGEKAGPRIAALSGSAKISAIKEELNKSLEEACIELKLAAKGKNLVYQPSKTGKGMPIEIVSLNNRGTTTQIGAIWNASQLYEPTKNPVGGKATTFINRVTKEIFVADAKKQYVQRFIIRNLSDEDIKTMKSKAGLKGAVKGSIEPTGPEHKATIQEHVMGKKPSPFISATKTPGGQITNEKGESFDSGDKAKIDLCYINSNNIFDLSTKVGQDEWGLSDPQSQKAEQALKDVIRTQEVLIKGEIPSKALEKI